MWTSLNRTLSPAARKVFRNASFGKMQFVGQILGFKAFKVAWTQTNRIKELRGRSAACEHRQKQGYQGTAAHSDYVVSVKAISSNDQINE